jgi:D-alanyl-lipoteichoic acid acyltransferase DltB (MBOAT superfamily)
MLFNSFDFLIFFIAVFVLQFFLPHRPRNIFLLLASYFFYGCWDWRFLSLMWLSTVLDFICGQKIGSSRSIGERKKWLALSITGNLAMLGFFKYFNFFIDSANQFFEVIGLNSTAWHLNIILPVGISFYTFQTMSYSIDVYRKEIEPERDFLPYSLYVSFFPQLVAGPIERARHLLPQMKAKPAFLLENLYIGSWWFLFGLFKKIVVADNLAGIVQEVFSPNTVSSGLETMIGVYAFAFQIYCDFSGYTDIARGAAKILGYDICLNFRMPYFSKNPSEFWQRWHISLSSWLRDYLYIPLGGNKKGPRRTLLNLMLTMLLGGLWHGAGWTFILWGFYHGVLLILYRVVGKAISLVKFGGLMTLKLWDLLRALLMFHLACFGWILFRSESLSQTVNTILALSNDFIWTYRASTWSWQLTVLVAPLLILDILEERIGQRKNQTCPAIFRISLLPRTCAYATLILMLVALGNFGGQPFIYFQF